MDQCSIFCYRIVFNTVLSIGIVGPFAIKSSVTELSVRHNLFLILRLNTLLFGIFSIILMVYAAKNIINLILL